MQQHWPCHSSCFRLPLAHRTEYLQNFTILEPFFTYLHYPFKYCPLAYVLKYACSCSCDEDDDKWWGASWCWLLRCLCCARFYESLEYNQLRHLCRKGLCKSVMYWKKSPNKQFPMSWPHRQCFSNGNWTCLNSQITPIQVLVTSGLQLDHGFKITITEQDSLDRPIASFSSHPKITYTSQFGVTQNC